MSINKMQCVFVARKFKSDEPKACGSSKWLGRHRETIWRISAEQLNCRLNRGTKNKSVFILAFVMTL